MRMLVVLLLLASVSLAHAQDYGDHDSDAARLVAELMGAPVFAAGGAEIGEVTDVSMDEDGIPVRIRMAMDARLGLGGRIVEVPKGTFIALRGAVVVELPAEAVSHLPETAEPEPEK